MIVQSDYLTEGLFGQIFIWMLEVLPYIDSKGWKPEWQIRTKNYGQQPDFNIFPGIIDTTYEPIRDGEIVSFEQLNFYHQHKFRNDFEGAGRCWNSHFRFTDDVTQRLDAFWHENFADDTVLGIHYRGTDKNTDNYQTNNVTRFQFLSVVEDFLSTHPDVTAIFVATDDNRFVEAMHGFPKVRLHVQTRSQGTQPLWNDQRVSDKQAMAKDAILDALSLSRCRYVLKCMSQLSAFCKIFNPEIEAYRVTACKNRWFPEAYIPTYQSENRSIRGLLKVLQDGDVNAPLHLKMAGAPKSVSRLASQAWRRRSTITTRARRAILGR